MGKFDNIIIVSDIDFTFLGKDRQLVPRNLEAVEYFKKDGGTFTLATGRESYMIKPAIPEVESIINAPIIGCNGAYLYNFGTGEILCEQFLDDNAAWNILMETEKRFSPEKIGTRVSMDEKIFVENDYPSFMNFLAKLDGHYVHTKWSEIERGRWNKLVYEGNADDLAELREFLADKNPGCFEYCLAEKTIFEIMPVTGTKGTMLPKLKSVLGKPDATIFAIGDYENDAQMLKAADFAAVPENGLDSLRRILGSINVGHHENGAVADLIEVIERSYI